MGPIAHSYEGYMGYFHQGVKNVECRDKLGRKKECTTPKQARRFYRTWNNN